MKDFQIVSHAAQEEEFGFLITKPLQLMVVLALLEQLPESTPKELLIVDYFAGAEGLSQRLAKVVSANCIVRFFADEVSVYAWVRKKRYAKLFIDSDVGFARNLTLLNLAICSPRTRLAVYEEGLGTYRHDLYAGLKKKVLRLLGCGVYFGGNWRVQELYVYQPEECKTPVRAQKIRINKEIATLLQENQQKFEFIFDAADFFECLDLRRNGLKECVIYLSNWQLEQSVIERLKSMSGLVIVKPHPHIKSLDVLHQQADFVLATAGIPAEMLIAWASARFESVKVLHHGSSVVRYVGGDIFFDVRNECVLK